MRLNSFLYKEKKENINMVELKDGSFIEVDNLNDNFFWRNNYSFVYKKAYLNLIKSTEKEVLNTYKNIEVLDLLKIKINQRTRVINSSLLNFNEGVNFFNKTDQSRSFFPTGDYFGDNVSYTESLMGVDFDCEESRLYLKSKLDNKSICLFGGGKSIEDLFKDGNIFPKSIVNIDLYLDGESIKDKLNNNYESINLKADDKSLVSKLKEKNIHKFDEIWALFSVPYYSEKEEEIEDLFFNIENLLSEGGACRISPISFQNEKCAKKMIEMLKKINKTHDYNLLSFKETLIIKKLKKPLI